ncbi:MAG: ABC transporter ATP-binding protein, partial [Mycobacterium sp.]|nr:ABC transporter ATP-binding protein [Mycobacterium sp.]
MRSVEQCVRSGHVTLRDVSLTIERGEMVAIIGRSGAGKTALLDTMCGRRSASSGEIIRVSGNSGYVPQDDIIHRVLPLARTLRYAAALREVPVGVVDDVLRTLELTGRAAVPVGDLSGGERKRASIASELLTSPTLFFLDEPTSGLDPAYGAELMRALRRLAADGTTVVLTTHNPADADRCDKVAVLARGGHLVFFGTPAGARDYFGTSTLDEIYERLAGTDDPSRAWSDGHVRSRLSVDDGLSSAVGPRTAPHQATSPVGHVLDDPVRADHVPPRADGLAAVTRPFRQWLLLTQRNAEILTRAKLTVAILAGAPIMVLLMFLVLFRPGAFDPAHPSPATTVMIVFWLAFGGFFFGLTYGLLQICMEFGVLRRERFAGLDARAY